MNKVLIKILFSILIFLRFQMHSHNDNNLDRLQLNIPLIRNNWLQKSNHRRDKLLKEYWSNETNEDRAIIFIFLLQTHMQPNNFYWIIT